MLGIYIELTNGSEENQFDYLLCNFKPDQIYVREGPGFNVSSNVMKNANLINSAHELPTDVPLILFMPPQAPNFTPTTSLVDFVHPENAIYMFGPNHRNLDLDDDFGGRNPDDIVYIPTDTTDDMYSWIAASVALWDRRNG